MRSRTITWGLLVTAILVIASTTWPIGNAEAVGERVYQARSDTKLLAIPLAANEQAQLMAIVDPGKQVLSIYRIAMADGKITLLSVRNVHWDLQMSEFNGERPLPREIRSMLEAR